MTLIAGLAVLVLAEKKKTEAVDPIPPKGPAAPRSEVCQGRKGCPPLPLAETHIRAAQSAEQTADHGEPPGMKKPAEAGWCYCESYLLNEMAACAEWRQPLHLIGAV